MCELYLFQVQLSDNSNKKAFPFGVPAVEYNTSMCRMNGNKFTVFYDRAYKQPALTSFTVKAEQVRTVNYVAWDMSVFPWSVGLLVGLTDCLLSVCLGV